MQLDGHSPPLVGRPTIRACAPSSWGRTGSQRSPTCRSRTGPASSRGSSPAGSAARTSRSSARRTPEPSSATRWSAELGDGRRVALVHHASCGECERCLAGHESTCERFAAPTIRPGGFAERVRAEAWVEVPEDWPDWRGTMVEPLACVLRGAARVPRGRVLIVGNGFVGRLFGLVLERRGDEVFAVDVDPRRAGRAPDGPVDAVVLSGRGGVETALEAVAPGGTVLVFADAGEIPAAAVYRQELTVVGTRSAAPAVHARGPRAAPRPRRARAGRPAARALRRGARAVPPPRRAQGRLHPVRALRLHGPGDLRLEDVDDPVRGEGDVLLQVEVALTDGTDLKAYRRGHPVLLGPPPSPFGHEVCGIDVATGRRMVAANSAPCGACAACARGQETLCEQLFPLLNGAYAELLLVPERIARTNLLPVPPGLAPEVAAMAEPLACCLHGVDVARRAARRHRRDRRARADRADALRLRRRRRGPPGRRRLPRGASRARGAPSAPADAEPEGADVVIEAAGTVEAWERALELVRPGGTVLAFGGLPARCARRPSIRTGSTTRRCGSSAPSTTRRAGSARRSPSSRAARIRSSGSSRTRSGSRASPQLFDDPPRDYLKAAVCP